MTATSQLCQISVDRFVNSNAFLSIPMSTYKEQIRELGERIKYVRRARNITQSEVAAIAQISRTRMSQLESGIANPKFDTLCAIAFALDCDLATLVSIVSPCHAPKVKTCDTLANQPKSKSFKKNETDSPSVITVYNVRPVPFKSKLEKTDLVESS